MWHPEKLNHSNLSCNIPMMTSRIQVINYFLFKILCNYRAILHPDVLDKIKTGLQYASNYLETAKDIADLVSKSLGHNKQKQIQKRRENKDDEVKQPFGPSNLVSAFFRLMGLDSSKVAAIAVNSFIFLAQMVWMMLINVNVNYSNHAISMPFSIRKIWHFARLFLSIDKFVAWSETFAR